MLVTLVARVRDEHSGKVTLEIPADPVSIEFQSSPVILDGDNRRSLTADEQIDWEYALVAFQRRRLAAMLADMITEMPS